MAAQAGKGQTKKLALAAAGALALAVVALIVVERRGSDVALHQNRLSSQETGGALGAAPQVPSTFAPTSTPSEQAGKAAETAPPTQAELDQATRERILQCTSGERAFNVFHSSGDFSSLDELMAGAIQASGEEARSEIRIRNVHVRTASGETLRLHFSQPDAADRTRLALRMKLFGVDSENLPVAREIPKDLKSLGGEEAVRRFKSQGEVLLDEVTLAQMLKDGAAAELTSRNGHIVELQVFMQGKALACALEGTRTECRCL